MIAKELTVGWARARRREAMSRCSQHFNCIEILHRGDDNLQPHSLLALKRPPYSALTCRLGTLRKRGDGTMTLNSGDARGIISEKVK
jgi:hypothetical protein